MEYHDWILDTVGSNFRLVYSDEALNLASRAWEAATKNTSPNTSEPGGTTPPQIKPIDLCRGCKYIHVDFTVGLVCLSKNQCHKLKRLNFGSL